MYTFTVLPYTECTYIVRPYSILVYGVVQIFYTIVVVNVILPFVPVSESTESQSYLRLVPPTWGLKIFLENGSAEALDQYALGATRSVSMKKLSIRCVVLVNYSLLQTVSSLWDLWHIRIEASASTKSIIKSVNIKASICSSIIDKSEGLELRSSGDAKELVCCYECCWNR